MTSPERWTEEATCGNVFHGVGVHDCALWDAGHPIAALRLPVLRGLLAFAQARPFPASEGDA